MTEDDEDWEKKELLERYVQSFGKLSEYSVSLLKLAFTTAGIFVALSGVMFELVDDFNLTFWSGLSFILSTILWLISVGLCVSVYLTSGAAVYLTFDDEALEKKDPRSHFHNSLTTNRAVLAGSIMFLVISTLLFTIGLIGIIIPESQRIFAFIALLTVIVLAGIGYYYLIKYNEQMTLDYDE